MLMDVLKRNDNWKTFTEFEKSLDHENYNIYLKEKCEVLLNINAIAGIYKVIGKGVDGEDLHLYKFEMVNGNEHLVLIDD